MTRSRAVWPVLGLVMLGLAGAAWLLWPREGHEAGKSRAGGPRTYRAFRAAVGGGIPARPRDPPRAAGDGTWTLSRHPLPAALSAEPVDPASRAETDPAWEPLATWFAGGARLRPMDVARIHCSVTTLTGRLETPCMADLALGIERDAAGGAGRIVGVRDLQAPEPGPGPEDHDACAEYVACMAQTWLDRHPPWPGSEDGDAISVRYQAMMMPDTGTAEQRRARATNTLALLRDTLEKMPGATQEQRAARRQIQDLIAFYEWVSTQEEPSPHD